MSKMKRAKIVKLSLDELAGVDAGAQSAAGEVVMKRKLDDEKPETMVATTKRAALTSAVMGHSHLLNSVDDMQSGCTSSEKIERADGMQSDSWVGYHSHSWIRDESGAIVIGESAGHTHEIATTSATLAAKAAIKSSLPIEPVKVSDMTTKIVALTEKQFAHYGELNEADRETFAAKSSVDRDSEVAKALEQNPIVFTGEVTKTVVRLKDGDLAKRFAMNAEESAVELAKAKTEITKANEARELVELTKRAADTIGNLAGDDGAHVALLKAAESIPDEAKRKTAIETLKSANAALAKAKKPGGFGGSGDPQPGDPLAEWNGAVAKFAEANGIKDLGLASERFLGTSEGTVAKRAYDKSRAYATPQPQ